MQGIAFDGVSIWAADSEDGIVAKINRTDGSYVKYATGQGAFGVAFDGNRIWVSNIFANSVTRMEANGTKKELQVMQPFDLVADGSSIWVSSSSNDSAVKIKLTDVDSNFPSIPYYDVGDYPIGILYDGLNIWTANNLSGNVTKLVD
jgi:outer membrane lipoprotein-sorting protein